MKMRLVLTKILVGNGVNMDLLGKRQTKIYGSHSLKDIESELKNKCIEVLKLSGICDCELDFFQTNSESEFINHLSKGWDGAILNFGAWTHTSLAIADRLAALQLIFVELHMSNISIRESYRHRSYMSQHALGVVYGFGKNSYLNALFALGNALKI